VASRSPEGARRAHWEPISPQRSFEQMLHAAGWTEEVLAEIDAAVIAEREVQTRLNVDARGGQLDLFVGTTRQ